MKQGRSIFTNTIFLYAKIIISAIVTLISTRVALKLLGVEDFGLYNLVAGVIAMLSFVNGALLVSTQRFLSVAFGKKADVDELKNIFNVSLLIHFCLSILLLAIFLLFRLFLFEYILNINEESVSVAYEIYDIMVITSIITIFTVPYNAEMNAHEDMWMFAIIEVVVNVIKLGGVFFLYITTFNLLMTYTVLMLLAISVGILLKYIWCVERYPEARIEIKRMQNFSMLRNQLSFVSWNTFGALASIGRNQGVAVLLNYFFGTFINAAYGIANQLNTLVSTFAATITTVFSPIIMKYRGENNTEQMMRFAILSSKISFFLSSLFAIPLIIELEEILEIWLTNVPEYTLQISLGTIVTFVIMQMYPGLTRAIYAVGNIKWYQIVISMTILMIIPIGYVFYLFDYSPEIIAYLMILAQFLVLIETIVFTSKVIGFNWLAFCKYIFISGLCFIGLIVIGFGLKKLISFNDILEIIIVGAITIVMTIVVYGYVLFTRVEREKMCDILIRKYGR